MWNFIIPFSSVTIWILLFVGLVTPNCSLALIETNYKSPTTPTSPPPPYHEAHPPSYPESLVQNNNDDKPPSAFEYLKLVKVWVPTFCMTRTCVDNNPPSIDFSLHGLWPQNNSDPQPRDCMTRQFFNWHVIKREDQNLWEGLKTLWPVLDKKKEKDKASFWDHEWTAHGTCAANLSPEKYLKLSIKISQKLNNLKDILRIATITPGGNQFESNAIFNAIKAAISNSDPQIVCEWINNKPYLSKVMVCLDESGDNYKNCVPGNPRDDLIKCPRTGVFFPIR